VIDLLDDGQIAGAGGVPASPIRLDLGSVENAWRTFIASESQGFRAITIPLPADAQKDSQFRVTMRLRGTTWRLTGIDLPAPLREELIKRAAAATK
jgi:hypothetical protein